MEFFAQGRDGALLLRARRAVLAFKGHGGVFEELLLPGVELRGLDAVQIADVGDGLVLKEVKFQNRDLFFGRKSPPRGLDMAWPPLELLSYSRRPLLPFRLKQDRMSYEFQKAHNGFSGRARIIGF